MKLVLLGTGGYHPSDARQTACLMLPEIGVILDAGTAMYRAKRFLDSDELDIFLTHAHLDHVIGLTYLIDVLADRTMKRVTVHAEPEKIAAIRGHLFAEALFPVPPRCEFAPLAREVPLPGGGRLTHFRVAHPGGAVGFRLEWLGHSMAYVTDTTAAADAPYLDAIRDVDLLVHECYFPDSASELAKLTGHSTISEVARLAKNAKVGKLLLVHVDPSKEEADPIHAAAARAIFPGTFLASDLEEVEF
ncbi:MAG TPA: MBL fold metallo-hydrolase [Pirellulales bacterium]|jgi:ribonuclease BN (tRNA processing enzyme)